MTTATSQVEKHFQIHNVYKRSKHLYDVQKLKEEEHLQQIFRRKPTYSYSIETLDTRVDQSFVNSVQTANKKLNHDISEYKRRYQQQNQYSVAEEESKNHNETQSTFYQNSNKSSKVRIRAPDLGKMPGRKSFGQSPGVYRNQDQFNNFSLSSPRSKAQLNFSLNSPRSKSSLIQTENQNPQQIKKQIDSLHLTKLHEKNNFNNSVYKCLFEYSKINKYGKYSRKQKTIVMPKAIQHKKIESAEKSARYNRDPGLSQFYMSIGKQSPTHLSFRYQNQSERQVQYSGLRKTNEDFGTRKRKQDMLEKRLNQILKKKKVVDSRDDLCDYKFFNRDSYRKNQ